MKAYGDSQGITLFILNHGTSCFTPEKQTQHPPNTKQGGPRTSLDVLKKRKINLFLLLGFEPQTVQLTVILTTLLWLPLHQLLPVLKNK